MVAVCRVGVVRELQPHPSSVILSAPLACNADRTFRRRTFCSRRGRATVSPKSFVFGIARVSTATKCDVIQKGMWLQVPAAGECLRCKNPVVMWIPPAMPYAWSKWNTHISNTEEGWDLASVISASDSSLWSPQQNTLREPKMATKSSRHLCQSLDSCLFKSSVGNISSYIKFLHFPLCFQSSFVICVE